jgi:cell division protease FtsH
VLDQALLRPGRFDRQVTVTLPDIKEREAILAVHAKKLPLSNDVDLNKFARATSGMSGADLANLVNEAALFAASKDSAQVSGVEFEQARDKILMGVARETMVISEKERKMTAVHEAGHALPYYYLKNVSPLHKVTIIPRGRALGLTVSIPEEDVYAHTRSWFLDQLVVLYGGWAAETIVYDDTTTGTQNDIERATEIARKMVCEWGMSKEMGAIAYGEEEEHFFMGREIARHKTQSEQTARNIDVAIESILSGACKQALLILKKHKDKLEKLAEALFERETLSDSEIRELLCIQSA